MSKSTYSSALKTDVPDLHDEMISTGVLKLPINVRQPKIKAPKGWRNVAAQAFLVIHQAFRNSSINIQYEFLQQNDTATYYQINVNRKITAAEARQVALEILENADRKRREFFLKESKYFSLLEELL
jgi:hypothetical protein